MLNFILKHLNYLINPPHIRKRGKNGRLAVSLGQTTHMLCAHTHTHTLIYTYIRNVYYLLLCTNSIVAFSMISSYCSASFVSLHPTFQLKKNFFRSDRGVYILKHALLYVCISSIVPSLLETCRLDKPLE